MSLTERHSIIFILVLATCLLPFGCKQKPAETFYTDSQRLMLDTTNNHTKNIDSLLSIADKYRQRNQPQQEVGALAELGHACQTASQYTLAIRFHQRQLAIATQLKDTLMMASAMNDLGVNYRRMGLLHEGFLYHSMAIDASDNPGAPQRKKLMKCEAIGYNGLGNIYTTLGYYKKADSTLRRALAIETRLGSYLGMNVDNSNIGVVFEKRGMTDSALVYYKKSYEYSKKAQTKTGIAYSHMNFGRIFQSIKQYDRAIEEFNEAMNIIDNDRDLWLWMQPCIALAGAYVETGNTEQAEHYLALAMNTARRIGAKEYYSQIYKLYADYYHNTGDYQKALENYTLSNAAKDSIVNSQNLFEIENLQETLMQQQNESKIKATNEKLEKERLTNILLGILMVALVGLIISFWYISHIRLQANKRHKQLISMRDRFFTNITHEFRTPLTLIQGYGKEIANANPDEMDSIRRAGSIIVGQGEAMLKLVNQLLDISKIRSKVEKPAYQRGNIVPYLETIVDVGQQFTKAKHIMMRFNPRENEIIMDIIPDYMNKIMFNLISNAVKFTPEHGNITIESYTERNRLMVTVTDTGHGISQESLPHLFEPFFQERTEARETGTGVGLSLVQQMVLSMQGTINVESQLGKGTTFTIALPLRHGDTPGKAFKAEAIKQTASHGLQSSEISTESNKPLDSLVNTENAAKVLIVEDNANVALFIGRQLKGNYQVFYADNGIEGLEKTLNIMPDIILTDLMMPGMDGMELCKKVRSTPETSTIPIIIISAKAEQEDLEEGLRAGANAYLFKPFSVSELLIRVEWILTERRMLQEKFTLAAEQIDNIKITMTQTDRDFISRFTNAVYNQMRTTDIDHDLLAQTLCMSKSTLRRKISDLTQDTLSNYITKIRIDYARQLLKRYPEDTIANISQRCGFSDQAYFSRQFKRLTGLSPVQYRKNITT